MLRRVALVRTNVSEERSASVLLMMEALRSTETSVLKEPHGVTSQMAPFFIVTAVKTSNRTIFLSFHGNYIQTFAFV
jgi:hypothetical protein